MGQEEGNKVGGLTHTRWIVGRGYLRNWKWIGGERVVIGRGECVLVRYRIVIDVKVDT